MCAHTAGASAPETETEGTAGKLGAPDWKNNNIALRQRYLAVEAELAAATASDDSDAVRTAQYQLGAIGDAFYTLNRGLAYASARRFVAGTSDLDDYVAAAALGLWEAFLRWDPERAVTFSTFSRQYIAGRVQRAVRQVEFHHLTQHEFNLRKRIRATQIGLAATLERPPTFEEIAIEAGVPIEKVSKTLSPGAASLETPIGDGEGTLADVVAAVGVEHLDNSDEQLDSYLDELSALELWVVCARSDIYDGDNQSLVEVADTIGIGREIARRAETRGRLRLAAAKWAADNGRNPAADELATASGKVRSAVEKWIVDKGCKPNEAEISSLVNKAVEHVETYHTVNYADAKRRWRRIDEAERNARNSAERATAHQRRARLGEEILSTVQNLAIDLGRKRGGDDGEALGTDETSWLLFQAFLAWDENSNTSYPTWARKFVNDRTSIAQSDTDDDTSDVTTTWSWISHQLSRA